MSEVASLELCKTLHELSGWGDTEKSYNIEDDVEDTSMAILMHPKHTPAYTLGYLLRKLPGCVELHHYENGEWSCDTDGFGFENADTPEDAACKLAIELLKQGIIKPTTADGGDNG